MTSVVERGRPGIELVYRHLNAMRPLLRACSAAA
jgi:hypothetical protein